MQIETLQLLSISTKLNVIFEKSTDHYLDSVNLDLKR